jgi:hypothetical protein
VSPSQRLRLFFRPLTSGIANQIPCRHDVEVSPGNTFEQIVQSMLLCAARSATDPLVAVTATTVQPSRPAASWSGCNWFSMVWPRSAVLTRTDRQSVNR